MGSESNERNRKEAMMTRERIIEDLVVANPFKPFYVNVPTGHYNIEEAWLWQSLVEDGIIDPEQVEEIGLLNTLHMDFEGGDFDEKMERRERAAFFNPEEYKKLQTRPEFKAKAKEVIAEHGCCDWCGSTKDLQWDHVFYLFGLVPWDDNYPDRAFRVLCRRCHAQRHGKPVHHTRQLRLNL
jgi:hypothetical protein